MNNQRGLGDIGDMSHINQQSQFQTDYGQALSNSSPHTHQQQQQNQHLQQQQHMNPDFYNTNNVNVNRNSLAFPAVVQSMSNQSPLHAHSPNSGLSPHMSTTIPMQQQGESSPSLYNVENMGAIGGQNVRGPGAVAGYVNMQQQQQQQQQHSNSNNNNSNSNSSNNNNK
eukprot:CFRG4622T1